MSLDKAIEVNTKIPFRKPYHLSGEEIVAIKLGIEALKRLQKLRGYSMTQVDTKLPGETED